MPQPFTVHCLFPANFHPEASEESWLCSITKWKAALIYTPDSLLRIIICIRRVTPKVTLISSVTCRERDSALQVGHRVTEINLSHFLVHSGRLLFVENKWRAEIKGRYLLLCNITGRWLGVIEFPLGSQSPFKPGLWFFCQHWWRCQRKMGIKEGLCSLSSGSRKWLEPYCVINMRCLNCYGLGFFTTHQVLHNFYCWFLILKS